MNTGECVAGPGGHIVVNKVGKLMDVGKCATYKGREYDELDFHRAVHPESTPQAAFTTTFDQDVGEIAVVVDDGSIVFTDQLGTRIDIVDAAKKFMATHADKFHYVMFFPNFNHAEGSFHNDVKNDILGIGKQPINNSATFGTQFLENVVLLRNFNEFPADNNARIMSPAPNNDSPLSLITHEAGHRVAAWVQADEIEGPRIRATNFLLGRNNAHWCFYLDGPSTGPRAGFSSMEGNRWFDNGDGTFTTVAQTDGYSQIDQYLWGFRSSGQVGGFYKLDPGKGKINPDCSHVPFIAGFDTPWTFSYPKKNVSVDDVIRVNGARVPDVTSSRKNFRVAFVILARQGTFPTAGEIARVDNLRLAWEPYFRDESGGGQVFTALGPVDMDSDGHNDTLDCDDDDPLTFPGAAEVCNGNDDDCDGLLDEDFDQDQDLYTTCGGDCNDDPNTGRFVNPGATEVWNGVDDNCDNVVDNVNLIDGDADGYFTNPADPSQTDCDDANAAVNPGAMELVNGVDDNCNGFFDCSDPTRVLQSDSGPRGNDGFDNDCNGIIDG
ncbi:MAG TPA: putative metal-binding motif-containing protein [Candidatus Polarisedimenticolia bacterium]|nr:putative metal-binding motif-containing protein [Candidatus Polarisedimenticolia bacterium]